MFFFFQAEDGIRDVAVTGVQTCALPIYGSADAAIGVADVFAENQRDQQDAGQDGESIHSQMGVDFEQQASHDREEKKVVDHGDDTGGKEVVEIGRAHV